MNRCILAKAREEIKRGLMPTEQLLNNRSFQEDRQAREARGEAMRTSNWFVMPEPQRESHE